VDAAEWTTALPAHTGPDNHALDRFINDDAVKLMPTIKILDIRVPVNINDGEPTAMLPAIATLSQLRKLHVNLDETLPILAADMCALRNLTQLQELSLYTGDSTTRLTQTSQRYLTLLGACGSWSSTRTCRS
jgi:hypothetical protein